eukprot:3475949-Pyramimonas_sp.AAC.2
MRNREGETHVYQGVCRICNRECAGYVTGGRAARAGAAWGSWRVGEAAAAVGPSDVRSDALRAHLQPTGRPV